MRRGRHDLVSPSCCLSGLVLLLTLSARAQRQAETDPAEVAALEAIFSAWSLRASPTWNISGEPCSGTAIDDTEIYSNPNLNPAIKCNCSYNVSTVCHITQLDLSQNYLTGSLPDFIGKLTQLQFLALGINALTGVLPRELGNLKNLISLSISTNKFVGPLPEVVENLTKLEQLYIDSCGLSGALPSTFSKLKNLWASDNDFTGKIPDYIGSLSNFTDLRLQGNKFDGPIPASFSNLVQLTNLLIGDLTGEVSSLAFVVNMTSLHTLSLRNSRISDNLASVDFSKFLELVYLDLSFNSITGKVSPILLNVRSLTFLYLGSNNLSGSLPDRSPSGELVEQDFDIKTQTNGKSYSVVKKQYNAEVTNNFIEIHLFWAGKGTCCIPTQGFYGPSISALSVSSYDLTPTVGSNNEGDPGKKKRSTASKTGLLVGVVTCVAVLGFLALTGTFIWRQKRRRSQMEMKEMFSIVGRPNVFSYGEIKSATDSFSPGNILGRGGYGLVYKGKLHDGRMVAVKQLSRTSHQGKKEFMTEIVTISSVQHRNLVKLHGCCMDSKAPLLVYEYLENGSLDRAIFGKTELSLDWRTRFEICVGIARGLAYLHEESSMRIVHRDIKASNVLLDADLNPKISDFGLARHYKDSMTHLNTGVAGTLGYLAPEYAMMGHLTEKADVFAFGIVTLEIISGRPNFHDSLEEDEKYLLGCVWHLHERQRTLEVLDKKLTEFDEEEAARVINVALLCTMGLPQKRPPMSKVVSMLTEDIETTGVDTTMRPSYVREWELKSFSNDYVSGSSIQQSSASAPSSSSNNPGIHTDTSPMALSPCSSGGIN